MNLCTKIQGKDYVYLDVDVPCGNPPCQWEVLLLLCLFFSWRLEMVIGWELIKLDLKRMPADGDALSAIFLTSSLTMLCSRVLLEFVWWIESLLGIVSDKTFE